jgi:hypothetical protein
VPGGPLQISRSSDGGRSWTELARVRDEGRLLDNGFLLQLPNGDVLLTGRSLIDGRSYRLPVWRSRDNGATWSSYLSVIDANESPGGATNRGLWEPFLFLLPDGRLSVLYADETVPGYSQVISQRVSPDRGLSWGPKWSAVKQPDGYPGYPPGSLRPGMPVVARMADGRYILVFEVIGLPGQGPVYEKFSTDAVTWDGTFGTRVPGHRCGPYVLSLTSGRLLVTSCTLGVSYSDDFGATWRALDPAPWAAGESAWPALYQTGLNEVAVTGNRWHAALKFGALTAFHDEFEDGDDAGWTRYGGAFQLAWGAYWLNNASANASGKALAGDTDWTNGAVTADLTLKSPTGNAGVMSRVTNPGTGADAAFGYYAGLSASGTVVLGKQANGWSTIAVSPMPVELHRAYKLRLSTVGDMINVYVDGVLRISAADASFRRGRIGVRSHFANAKFDNVAYTPTTSRDSFSDGNDLGWRRVGGSSAVATGAYDLSNAATTGKSAWMVLGRRTDLTLESDVRIASGSGDAGVIFRATNLGSGADAMQGYYAGLNDARDTVLVGRMDGRWTQLAAAPLPVGTNTSYRMKVSAIGPRIRVYVGDMETPRLDIIDTTWSGGLAGVRAHYVNASFDNVTAD